MTPTTPLTVSEAADAEDDDDDDEESDGNTFAPPVKKPKRSGPRTVS